MICLAGLTLTQCSRGASLSNGSLLSKCVRKEGQESQGLGAFLLSQVHRPFLTLECSYNLIAHLFMALTICSACFKYFIYVSSFNLMMLMGLHFFSLWLTLRIYTPKHTYTHVLCLYIIYMYILAFDFKIIYVHIVLCVYVLLIFFLIEHICILSPLLALFFFKSYSGYSCKAADIGTPQAMSIYSYVRVLCLSHDCILDYLKVGVIFDTFWCARWLTQTWRRVCAYLFIEELESDLSFEKGVDL